MLLLHSTSRKFFRELEGQIFRNNQLDTTGALGFCFLRKTSENILCPGRLLRAGLFDEVSQQHEPSSLNDT